MTRTSDYILVIFALMSLFTLAVSSGIEDQKVNISTERNISTVDVLLFEEGYSSVPYYDSEGYITIGIGQKLAKKKYEEITDYSHVVVTLEEAKIYAHTTVVIIDEQLSEGMYGYIYNDLSESRKTILVSMAYQIGVEGLYKFRNMWTYLTARNYEKAANEMCNSLWYKQTPNRATRHCKVMSSNSLKIYEDLL